MPTDPARRLVEDVLKEAASPPLIGEHYRRRDDLYIPAAPKLAQMLMVALDALEEIRDLGSGEFASFEVQDTRDALAQINAIAEEE